MLSRLPLFVAALFILLIGGRVFAGYLLDYEWWKEVGQLQTWYNQLLYSVAPQIAVTLAAFAAFWVAHARALKSAGTGLRSYPAYARILTFGLLILAWIVSAAAVDNWSVVRYYGSNALSGEAFTPDPVFGNPWTFYLFDVPFYHVVLRAVLGISFLTMAIYWVTNRVWSLRDRFPRAEFQNGIDISELNLGGSLDSMFVRATGALFLFALAAKFYLDRYDLLTEDHGFMVGVEWIGESVRLPLQWLAIVTAVSAGVLFLLRRPRFVLMLAVVLPLKAVVPGIVSALYVRPNEISIQKPYIQRHIEATRDAYHLSTRVKETEYAVTTSGTIDVEKNRQLLDNVRLWDWRAFHDSVTQLQPLRPYVYADTDVDRYEIDGQMRQVLLAPRELELSQLGDARSSWINPHFIFTHGYGLVLAEANRITPNGLPQLFIQNAPPEIKTKSLKLTRPEIYYGEQLHEPVFVRTARPEFNYPSGSENVDTRYDGKGGFPMSSVPMRLAAAVATADWNILLTGYLTGESRMMVHRKIAERLDTMAGFVTWDADPYLVISNEGRLLWMVDGYTTSGAYPYARAVSTERLGRVNYLRNSVKATVDAYDGTTTLYQFDATDPLIRAYAHLFPGLFKPAADMPADLRAHTRTPEVMFRVQAEMYRTFHMREPEAFYNKADLWDIATYTDSQVGHPTAMSPTYAFATVPGESKPEFVLLLPFTPHNKQNLIGMMMARCDGEHQGEIVFLLLSKQAIVAGPLQVEARINQDQNISKDLTLWNQQGSQVVRGQILALPIDHSILYVAPIYIQAAQARMPQLKKVALAVAESMAYADTYEQALAQLGGPGGSAPPSMQQVTQTKGAEGTPAILAPTEVRGVDVRAAVRGHLQRYRDLTSQGKLSEAGKELEAIESLVRNQR
ncbi:MAG: UPF0182 family protein [Bryobacteraceae bacterium]